MVESPPKRLGLGMPVTVAELEDQLSGADGLLETLN